VTKKGIARVLTYLAIVLVVVWGLGTAVAQIQNAYVAQPFKPCMATTISISASDSTATSSATLLSDCGPVVRIVNSGDSIAYVDIADSSVSAGTADHVVAADSVDVINWPGTTRYIAARCNSSETTTLYVEVGNGY
jgi:Na+-transporting methylmalonyl-CoA/oxaloacetate decarboxylase gamma subunit